jgi:nitroreductase
MILETMRRRRTTRTFRPEPVADPVLTRLVEAAGLAPSAANKQPWRFLVVRDRSVIETAAREVEAEVSVLEPLVATEFRPEFESYERYFTAFRGAPVLIVPVFRPLPGLSRMLAGPIESTLAERLSAIELHATISSVAMAVQNLLLLAEDLGLATCCTTAPLVAASRLAAVFDVPDGWCIAALVGVGHAAESPPDPGRKPVVSILRWR